MGRSVRGDARQPVSRRDVASAWRRLTGAQRSNRCRDAAPNAYPRSGTGSSPGSTTVVAPPQEPRDRLQGLISPSSPAASVTCGAHVSAAYSRRTSRPRRQLVPHPPVQLCHIALAVQRHRQHRLPPAEDPQPRRLERKRRRLTRDSFRSRREPVVVRRRHWYRKCGRVTPAIPDSPKTAFSSPHTFSIVSRDGSSIAVMIACTREVYPPPTSIWSLGHHDHFAFALPRRRLTTDDRRPPVTSNQSPPAKLLPLESNGERETTASSSSTRRSPSASS